MLDKLSTKSLLAIFGVLAVIVVLYFFVDSNHGERTFRKDLVTIDTSKVTEIQIYPKATKHKEVRLYKSGKNWKVDLPNNRTATVPEIKIKSLMENLLRVTPESVAAQSTRANGKNIKLTVPVLK